MRLVGVQGGRFTLASDATSVIPLDTTTPLDPAKSVPIKGGNCFGLDIVAANESGERRDPKDWFYIPNLEADGLNMTRIKSSNAAAAETDTGNCYWLEFTEGGVSEGLVRGILDFTDITSASSSPTVTSYNGTWPGNVVDSSRLLVFYAWTTQSQSNSQNGPESTFGLTRTGTTFTVTPTGPSPNMSVRLWVVELTGSQHSVQNVQFVQSDYVAQLAASADYVVGGTYAVGDTFRAVTQPGSTDLGKYVVKQAVASAPALDSDGIPTNWEQFAHFVGFDEQSFELTLNTAVDWSKTIPLPPVWTQGGTDSNPMNNAQLVVKQGSSSTKVSCEIQFPDNQAVNPTTRSGYLDVWTFDDPAIRAIHDAYLIGSDNSWTPENELLGSRGNGPFFAYGDEDDVFAAQSVVAFCCQNNDDRSESDAIAGTWGRIMDIGTSGANLYQRRSFQSAVMRVQVSAFTGLDEVSASNAPAATFSIVSGNSQAYRLRVDLATPLAGTITTLNGEGGDTLAVNVAGATNQTAQFDIVAADHTATGDLAHTITGETVNLSVTDGTETSRTDGITLPGAWQHNVTFNQASSPSESVLKLVSGADVNDKLDVYSADADPGRATEEGRPYNANNPFTLIAKVFRRATGIWTGAHTEEYSLAGGLTLNGDYTLDLSAVPAGAYTFPSPWLNPDGLALESDGTCIKPSTSSNIGRFRYNEITTEETITQTVTLASANDNDAFGPAIWNNQDLGYYLDISHQGGEIPDRIEVRRMDAGQVVANLGALFIAELQPDDKMSIRYFRSTGVIEALVNGVSVGSVVDTTYQNDDLYLGLFAQWRNTNGTCIKAIESIGLSDLRIASCNSSQAPQSLVNGTLFTVEYTENHAPANFTFTDEVGTEVVQAVSALGPAQGSVILAIDNLRKGPVSLAVDGITGGKELTYPAPAGQTAVDLGATIALPGVTAQWLAGNELTYDNQTVEGNAVTIEPDGHITVAGTLPQEVRVREHDSGVYGAYESVYVYSETVAAIPTQSAPGAVTLSLLPFAAYLGVPQGEIGSSGSGWSIVGDTLPAGLAVSGTDLTGTVAEGDHPVQITFTSPSGAQEVRNFTLEVRNAPVVAVPIADQTIDNGDPFTLDTTGTFTDESALTVTAQLVSGNAISTIGLAFDGTVFSGTAPDNTDEMIRLRATDAFGQFVDDIFALTYQSVPNVPPTVINPIGAQVEQAGVAWSLTHADNVFDEPVTYSAQLQGGAALSTVGITYDPINRVFAAADPAVQNVAIELIGTDGGGLPATDLFTVDFTLQAPVLVGALPNPLILTQDQTMTPIDLSVMFQGLPASYAGTNLPPGLSISGNFLQGTPTAQGSYTDIKVTATNAAGSTDSNTVASTVNAPALPGNEGSLLQNFFV